MYVNDDFNFLVYKIICYILLQWGPFEKVVLLHIVIHRYCNNVIDPIMIHCMIIPFLVLNFGIHSLLFALMWQGIPLAAEITIQGTSNIYHYSDY